MIFCYAVLSRSRKEEKGGGRKLNRRGGGNELLNTGLKISVKGAQEEKERQSG